ncbi:HAMP domain-containing sensor histidine kinase [Ruminococcus sp.]|uniref:sensor histidine kinase n=1 Tax=Ruminococcus sp. TaxID=41978 RepID=UPI0025E4AC59|nr:HAMP domain-containing sensor histidine kinase [Ruminococcus sp.]
MKPIKHFRRAGSRIPLKFTVWLYFIIFTIVVFALLWLFQIFYFDKFYQRMKIRTAVDSIETIIDSYNNDPKDKFYRKFNEVAVKNEVCVLLLDRYGRVDTKKEVIANCIIHDRNYNKEGLVSKIQMAENGFLTTTEVNPRTNENMLIVGCRLGSASSPQGYLIVNSRLDPVPNTVYIVKSQLLFITSILIVVAFVLSLYLAKRISSPIDRITKSAERLAKGDFSTKFDGRGYLEAKQLADTLTYAEKELSKVDTMQRDLIANVSHDLRTPLTMLKAYAEMIRDLSGDNPVKRNEHLEIIISETDRLALLVNDMLDLSKLESGKQKLSLSEFSITDKLGEIIERFKGLSDKNGYNIMFTPDDDMIVCCDVVKIEQVIYNLINNAINYTGDDKKVFVRQINKDDGVIVEVEDTGNGIEEDKIKLIFDKYYRSENHKREVVGTGLGLSIVKAVLKMHNFDYGVRSTLGKGSTFWFKIRNVKK